MENTCEHSAGTAWEGLRVLSTFVNIAVVSFCKCCLEYFLREFRYFRAVCSNKFGYGRVCSVVFGRLDVFSPAMLFSSANGPLSHICQRRKSTLSQNGYGGVWGAICARCYFYLRCHVLSFASSMLPRWGLEPLKTTKRPASPQQPEEYFEPNGYGNIRGAPCGRCYFYLRCHVLLFAAALSNAAPRNARGHD